ALVSEDTIRLTQDAVAECEAIFQAIEDVIAKIRGSGSMAKWTIYFRDSKIELLRSNLDRMKGNLNLLMGVIIHGTQMATERPDEASISAHRARIRQLMVEKEQYTQKYLEEKRKYDDLLEKINSTSTLGSVILLYTASSQDISGQVSPVANTTENPRRDSGDLVQAGVTPGNGAELPTIHMHALESSPPGQGDPHLPLPTEMEMETVARPAVQLASTPGPAASSAPAVSNSSTSTSPPSAQPPDPLLAVSARAAAAAASKTPEKPKKRDKAATVTKKLARGAGKTMAVALGVALFPITVPIYIHVVLVRPWWERKRQQRRSPMPTMPPPVLYCASPAVTPFYTQQQPQQAYYGPTWQNGMTYDSHRIPAELPAMHELPGQNPDMALVGRLLRTDLRYGRNTVY
ncbi:hypothetical protein C8A00DRAFT_38942, partial [Chaetomidium leptoderma]